MWMEIVGKPSKSLISKAANSIGLKELTNIVYPSLEALLIEGLRQSGVNIAAPSRL
jgi:hypothetical protein